MELLRNHIYKPNRLLYYIVPNEEQMNDFYIGKLPECLTQYDGKFGTYDCPGLVRVTDENGTRDLLGIEFRADDTSVEYPTDLECIELGGSFMITGLYTKDTQIDAELIQQGIDSIINDDKENPFRKEIKPKADSPLVQIYTYENKNRILVQAVDIPKDKFFKTVEPVTDSEKNLYEAAFHDPITGHFNWNYLKPIISGYFYMGVQDFAFVHFDVKDFNTINLVYGHDIANQVLTRITRHMSDKDWIYFSARCDNDNFAMMIKDMSIEETKKTLEDFFSELSIFPEDRHYNIYYRVGVVPMRNCLLSGDRVSDAGKLAQRLGTKINETEIIFYTDKMHNELDWAKKVKAYLEVAIENDEFLVYLQPKYDTSCERIRGAEALIRWRYQGKELMPPFRFIPIFEKDGSISKIDDIVLSKVCCYLKKWKEEGLPLYPISVNLSRKRMGEENLVEHLTKIVDSYGVDHSLIDFELTESAAYENQDYMVSVMLELKERDFKVSMDDFGTGYSSLSLLTVMPIDTLKIDKSFVDGIGTPKETYKDRAVIKHIISMATALNLTCLAEGAEEKQQVEKLRDFGCELIQGYYYSKPLPVEEYEEKLKSCI